MIDKKAEDHIDSAGDMGYHGRTARGCLEAFVHDGFSGEYVMS